MPQRPRNSRIGAIPGSVKDRVIGRDLHAAASRFCMSSEAAGDQSIWLWAMGGPYGVITNHEELEELRSSKNPWIQVTNGNPGSVSSLQNDSH